MLLSGVTARSRAVPDPPFFQAESVLVRLRLSTLFITEKELSRLRVEKPRIQVRFDAQGRTNVPQPADAGDRRRSPLDPLFNLAVRRLEVIDGVWIWNDQVRNFDFTAENAAASLAYEPARDRFNGTLAVRSTQFKDRQGHPVVCTSRARFVLDRRSLEVTEASFESGRTSLKAQGTLRDFRHPVIQAGYQATM